MFDHHVSVCRLSSAVAEHRRAVRPSRRTQGSRNPLRALAAREDIRQDYMGERDNSVAEERSQAQKSESVLLLLCCSFISFAHFVNSCLLQIVRTLPHQMHIQSHPQIRRKPSLSLHSATWCLFTLKVMKTNWSILLCCWCVGVYLIPLCWTLTGRRQVQVRLVEPSIRSLNSGDCFLLVTPEHCILWSGEFANKEERSKVSTVHVCTKSCKFSTLN